MSRRAGRVLVVGVVGVLAGAPCRGDGSQLDPAASAPAKVGERRRWRFEESLRQRLERTFPGEAEPRVLESFERVQAILVDEVLEVRDGKPARVRLTLERWERTAGERADGRLQADASLTGRVAVLQAADGTWTLEPALPEPSGAARRFLDRQAGRWRPGGDVAAIDSAFLPARPVREGERWDAAARVAPLAPGAPFTAIDRPRSKVTAKLQALGATSATTTLEGVLQLAEIPGTSDRFDEGGACQVAGRATWAVERRPSEGTGTLTQKVEGAAEGRLPDGLTYRTAASIERVLRWGVASD